MADSVEGVVELARTLVASMYGGWSEQDRDDLVQEVLVRYVRSFPGQSRPESQGAWLNTVIRNTARSMHGARERRPEDSESDDDPMGAFASAVSVHFASLIPVRDALIGQVLDLLDDERARTVLRLKYLDNLSSREIADELGPSPNTVDQVASRGKRRLQTALEQRPELVDELRRLHPRHY
jgi:RNA polymerase sigma factor (sigma-70 family)